MNQENITSPVEKSEDFGLDQSLRPSLLREFTGQKQKIANLKTYIKGARQRGEALDHVLLHGPPGLGKTTLAHIAAAEMGAGIKSTSGPVLEKKGDIIAILSDMEMHEVLFIDEIHRLRTALEEILYKAMEDFQIDVLIGQGPGAKTVSLHINPFTLVGATTRAGLLSNPLRNRFGITLPSRFLQPRRSVRDHPPQRRHSRHQHRCRGNRGRGPQVARHPAHRQPAAAPLARFCPNPVQDRH